MKGKTLAIILIICALCIGFISGGMYEFTVYTKPVICANYNFFDEYYEYQCRYCEFNLSLTAYENTCG